MMMECDTFQDLMTDYLEGELDTRRKAECAAHRLVCRECRGLFEDVRATVVALNSIGGERSVPQPELPDRILAATTAGEMNGCQEFDRLLAEYFDGVILAPSYQTFQQHFITCGNCRRLISGIEEAIALCHEIREERIEMAESLPARIVGVTLGVCGRDSSSWFDLMVAKGGRIWNHYLPTIDNARVAAGILILAASGLLVLSRYESLQGVANRASMQADEIAGTGQERFSRNRLTSMATEVAKGKFERLSREMNTILFTSQSRNESDPAHSSVREPNGSGNMSSGATKTGASNGQKSSRARSGVEGSQRR